MVKSGQRISSMNTWIIYFYTYIILQRENSRPFYCLTLNHNLYPFHYPTIIHSWISHVLVFPFLLCNWAKIEIQSGKPTPSYFHIAISYCGRRWRMGWRWRNGNRIKQKCEGGGGSGGGKTSLGRERNLVYNYNSFLPPFSPADRHLHWNVKLLLNLNLRTQIGTDLCGR